MAMPSPNSPLESSKHAGALKIERIAKRRMYDYRRRRKSDGAGPKFFARQARRFLVKQSLPYRLPKPEQRGHFLYFLEYLSYLRG